MAGQSININDFDYVLPEEKIAKYPLSERDSSKLLVYNKGRISESVFRDLPELLGQDTLLVRNDTRVVQSRLRFLKSTGSQIEIFCLEPHEPADYSLAFQQNSSSLWKCLVGNAKKWRKGQLEMELLIDGIQLILKAEKLGREKDAFLIGFSWEPGKVPFGHILEQAGSTPIPPYLNRQAEYSDKETYQTVYSKFNGSVAAPTAGLHFTRPVLDQLDKKGIAQLELTLHVGAGTFQPVIAEDISLHPMHAEHFFISRGAVEELLSHRGSVTAVGTTSTRVLESLYWLGCRMENEKPADSNPLFLDQWEAYRISPLHTGAAFENLLGYMEHREIEGIEGLTRLMIVPGYKYRIVDQLLTNYHQPKSTLLLLVAALIGEDWRKVYTYALENGFRFLSYGDSSLLIP